MKNNTYIDFIYLHSYENWCQNIIWQISILHPEKTSLFLVCVEKPLTRLHSSDCKQCLVNGRLSLRLDNCYLHTNPKYIGLCPQTLICQQMSADRLRDWWSFVHVFSPSCGLPLCLWWIGVFRPSWKHLVLTKFRIDMLFIFWQSRRTGANENQKCELILIFGWKICFREQNLQL